ncbi:TetR/AcrR family transcriptional regulator [Nitriliruptor alkaliphilus]|uniref:TetR/AcrR family transcriptional regulator n=1 Tax=Nitriliruptor alkaliphilus TaxID=427918 RepID=UPI00069765F9|nr:TetR/AcrR family transcriptional regulator [Nitriliruptor alkaliphilus]
MTDGARGRGAPGRPRDPGIDEAVLEVAAEQLVAGGLPALRMDALAEQVGVAKTTLYRRWPTRAHLLVAILARGQHEIGTPSTGDVRADLVTFTTRLAAALDPPLVRQLAAQLAAAVAEDPDLAAPVRELWADRRRQIGGIVEAGVERGQLRADVPVTTIVDQLAGALYYHVLVTGEPLGEAYAATLVDTVLRGALAG